MNIDNEIDILLEGFFNKKKNKTEIKKEKWKPSEELCNQTKNLVRQLLQFVRSNRSKLGNRIEFDNVATNDDFSNFRQGIDDVIFIYSINMDNMENFTREQINKVIDLDDELANKCKEKLSNTPFYLTEDDYNYFIRLRKEYKK